MATGISRRQFISVLGSVVTTWPITAAAQQSTNQMRHVAILASGGNDYESYDAAFRKRLTQLGWQENKNIQFEIRQAENDIKRAHRYAAELIATKPDVFLATNTQMVQSILADTRDIPIVFVQVPDPIGSGFIMSFAHPGGNVTGFTNFEPSVAGKWLEFLKDLVPGLSRVAVILDAGNPTASGYEKEIEGAAPTFTVEVSPRSVDGQSIEVHFGQRGLRSMMRPAATAKRELH